MKLLGSILVGSTVARCAATTVAAHSASVEPLHPAVVVPKTVISSQMRFVFAVGLEGTGHHYFVEVENYLFRANTDLVQIGHSEIVKSTLYQMEEAMGDDVKKYSANLNRAKENMRRLAQRGAELEFPGTVAFLPGKNSYPNGPGPKKALKYMDLRMLAEVAEEEGVDLRILYLRRPVRDTLIANTIHRQFQNGLRDEETSTPETKYMEYMQILLIDIAVMHSLLAELGAGFVVCHDFDRFGDIDQAAAISDFLAPNEHVSALLKTSFMEVAGAPRVASKESLLYEGADVVAARMQRKFDTFESQICSGMNKQ